MNAAMGLEKLAGCPLRQAVVAGEPQIISVLVRAATRCVAHTESAIGTSQSVVAEYTAILGALAYLSSFSQHLCDEVAKKTGERSGALLLSFLNSGSERAQANGAWLLWALMAARTTATLEAGMCIR